MLHCAATRQLSYLMDALPIDTSRMPYSGAQFDQDAKLVLYMSPQVPPRTKLEIPLATELCRALVGKHLEFDGVVTARHNVSPRKYLRLVVVFRSPVEAGTWRRLQCGTGVRQLPEQLLANQIQGQNRVAPLARFGGLSTAKANHRRRHLHIPLIIQPKSQQPTVTFYRARADSWPTGYAMTRQSARGQAPASPSMPGPYRETAGQSAGLHKEQNRRRPIMAPERIWPSACMVAKSGCPLVALMKALSPLKLKVRLTPPRVIACPSQI
jgi:hypothetical protein